MRFAHCSASATFVGIFFAAILLFLESDVDATTTTTGSASGSSVCFDLSAVGDGDCDVDNNFVECGYDGGDCCECTCVSQAEFECGASGYPCIDPECADSSSFVLGDDCVADTVGDAYCDEINNTEECGYDGGDCCSCTCVDIPDYPCGSFNQFACVDPRAPCIDDTPAPIPAPTPVPTPMPTSSPAVLASSSCRTQSVAVSLVALIAVAMAAVVA